MRALRLLSIASLMVATACSGSDPVNPDAGVDGGPGGDGGPVTDGGPNTDGGPVRDGGGMIGACDGPALTPPSNGICDVTPGTGGSILLRGTIAQPEGLLENGQVLVSSAGLIECSGCDCLTAPGAAEATVVACAEGFIGPALINLHDHITFTETPPTPPPNPNERYDHRHDWRRGLDEHTRIPSTGNQGGTNGVWWGELRNLMAGATSINGSGGADGLLRNLDRGTQREGLTGEDIYYSTFPLSDTDGRKRTNDCTYDTLDSPDETQFMNATAYTPHIAEGIELAARNEFLCLSGQGMGSTDVVTSKTAIVHGIGLLPQDWAAMAADGASLVWSPRTNISLYGFTSDIMTAKESGVNIGLGTDWTATGSMNMLRELRCVEQYNRNNLGGYLTDQEMYNTATLNNARAAGAFDQIGSLLTGRQADITIFAADQRSGYRAVLEADPEDVVLVLRGGTPLYGDAEIVNSLPRGDTGCEEIDVCGVNKRVCSERETGATIATHRAAIPANSYDLFYCDEPPTEPSCIPFRMDEFLGVPNPGTDDDGDGINNERDNCPTVFNAVRPLDNGMQADQESDGVGDACDACPLSMGTTGCAPPDPNDLDGDMVPDLMDNCPGLANMDQADRDMDMIGDVCDACPDESNPGGAACSVTIYDIKQRNVTEGRARIKGIVTGSGPNGYFVQHAPGDPEYDTTLTWRFSGTFVFAGAGGMKPARGDRVTVDGEVGDFRGQAQLSNATFTVDAQGQTLPDAIALTSAELGPDGAESAAAEGVLVELTNVTVTNADPEPGDGDMRPTNEFEVDGRVRINNYFFTADPLPVMGETIPRAAGIVYFANSLYKLEPRDANDIALAPGLLGFNPDPAYIAANAAQQTGVLSVELTRPAVTDATVSITSSDPGVVVPASVVVPAGMTSVDVPVTAVVALGAVTFTASFDGAMVTGAGIVYDDASPRMILNETLSPNPLGTNASGQVDFSLDLPGAVGGTTVVVTFAGSLATGPATVTVAEGDFTGQFTIMTGATEGAETLTLSIGANSVQIPFNVVASTLRPPAAGDLVITEVHRNPSGNDEQNREWFEIFNASTDEIQIDGLVVEDNNGAHTVSAAGTTLMPGAYGVIAYSADMATNGGITMVLAAYGADDLRLANGDDEIKISYMGTEIDFVDWGAGWPGAGQGVAMCLTFPYAADNNVQGSWSNSVGTYGPTTDSGSPGVASDGTNCP